MKKKTTKQKYLDGFTCDLKRMDEKQLHELAQLWTREIWPKLYGKTKIERAFKRYACRN